MADNRRHLTLAEVHATIEQRSIPEPNSGCLLWEGMISQDNRGPVNSVYGAIRLRRKMVKVHRVVHEFFNGPIPAGMHVLHKCDVPLCCNPAHLFLGDNTANIADKVAKDRARKKLTHEKAREIHAMRAKGMTSKRIGELMAVNPSTVSRIIAGKRRPAAMPAVR